jgi:DNA-directed RNA polymerase specialized sigma24 family protein
MDRAQRGQFEEFVRTAKPRLLRAFAGSRGEDAGEAAAEALAYAWEHWDRVGTMDNPAGYLFRVGQSRTRRRRTPRLPSPTQVGVPEVEPALIPALLALPETQRTAVWLVHACQWHYSEVAEALGTSVSMVGNHVRRGLGRLRQQLEVDIHA